MIMKKGFLSCLAVVALAIFLSAGSVFAAEENTGFYLGISGAYVIPQTMNLSDPDGGATYAETTLNNGYMAGVKTGWNTPFTKGIMALEMEYNYIRNEFDNSKVFYLDTPHMSGFGTFDGTNSIHALLFNVKARYPEGRIHPYAGFGLGWSYFVVGDITAREAGTSNVEKIKGDTGNGFCWQLMTGVDFDITPNLGVGIGYKYLATKPTIGSKNNGDEHFYVDADYRASMVTVGLTFTF
jgi:opacity protein-like surface antigen